MLNLEQLKKQFEEAANTVRGAQDAQELKNAYLGRKQGKITEAFGEFAALPLDQKQKFGKDLNSLKNHVEQTVESLLNKYQSSGSKVDLTVPAAPEAAGHVHPLTQTLNDLEAIFWNLGFTTEYGYEVENDWYNFTALNFPPDHPARDVHDTFYVKAETAGVPKEKLLLRTHTSPMQVRFMQSHKPPFYIIVPGNVYRNEATDATHEHTFGQLEGLVVGDNVTFASMTWALDYMVKKFFGSDVKTKLVPAYFPFVEPGAELAVSSPRFKNGKWVELLGCGMVHQNVFAAAGYPKNKYQGFAFGFGTDRFSIMKYGISDIRLLRENNLSFLSQF